ncbi:MAG TPA: terminase family protein [Candidatus Binatia bacterium]|nr:terminase family protein [Candidatus Binatia bacterium]
MGELQSRTCPLSFWGISRPILLVFGAITVGKQRAKKKHARTQAAMEAGAKRQSGGTTEEAADHGRVLRARGSGSTAGSLQEAPDQVRTGPDILASERARAVHGRTEERGTSSVKGNPRSDGRESAAKSRDLDAGKVGDHGPDHPRSEEADIHRIEYSVHLLDPFDKQRLLIDSPLKRKMVRAGRRGGKTTGIAILASEECVEKKRRVLYAVPTADQLARFWHETVIAFAELIEFGIVKKYESEKIIEYPGTEQRIRAKTAWNADTLRGDYGDLIILDEFQLMNEDTLEVVVYPMLIDNGGDLVLIYTPPRLHSRSASKATDKRHAAKMYKAKSEDPRWLTMSWTSHDNPHLSREGLNEVAADMTSFAYRLEIMAEDIEEVPGALWTPALIDKYRVAKIPESALPLVRVVVGVDPTGSSMNEAGIVGAGMGQDGHGYVIADKSLLAPTPRTWAQEAVWLYCDLKADRLDGERNYGGDMVKEVISTVDPNVNYHDVTATRGKIVRAEPIAALYEKGFIHHVGEFPQLEEEQCSYVPGISERSPNRMDALVWTLTDLFPENVRLTLVESRLEEMGKREQKIAVETSKQLTKPAIAPQTERCPNCESTAVVQRGPLRHCNSCNHEWGGPKPADAVGGRAMLK